MASVACCATRSFFLTSLAGSLLLIHDRDERDRAAGLFGWVVFLSILSGGVGGGLLSDTIPFLFCAAAHGITVVDVFVFLQQASERLV